MKSALYPKVSFPKLAVCGSARHGTKQKWVDLNHFLDGLRPNVASLRSSRVNGDDNATLKDERKGRRPFAELDLFPLSSYRPDTKVVEICAGSGPDGKANVLSTAKFNLDGDGASDSVLPYRTSSS